MGRATILALRIVIALALAGSLVVQTLIVPTIWADLDGAPPAPRIAFVTLIVLGVASLQVFAVCVWQLLTRVRRGSVFSESSFRYVDVITWAIVAAAVIVFAFAVLLAPGEVAPGAVGLVCGAALVLGGMALLVRVMRMLLRQAVDRDAEAKALQAELDEVV
ncbi:DUF2975 domain-containing protein [Microbacterium fluvii]|uniref:DUF2975 domain-containing protein n=1 Tax=Microbacterium fluvii TaxID=415215 RepID=A0ABW2HK47_9MICO|nr:DUF2975 domain-containing protein [Microbacterium fluvii]MCU4673677.1 DUF2975 domain-containing protein [Microbacterium fluvii]